MMEITLFVVYTPAMLTQIVPEIIAHMRPFAHRHKSPFRFLCVIVLLSFLSGMLDAMPVRAKISAAARPEFIQPDGTLKLDGSYSGPLDLKGWDVRLDPLHGPIFTSAQAESPTGWSGLGADPFEENAINGAVYAVAVDGNTVYIGGNFVDAGAVLPAADYIARWDGITWSALGSNGEGDGALNGLVTSIAVMGTDVYVGGDFTNVNNNGTDLGEADYIARWDGANWSALSSDGDGRGPLNGEVYDMASGGGNLYAVGWFTDVDNNGTVIPEADYVARWDGTNWSALGSNGAAGGSFTGVLRAIAVDGENVYVGGSFLDVNNNGTILPSAARIARWDGTNWSALGSNGAGGPALNGSVYAIAVSNGIVYAGGAFTDVKNYETILTAADYIARWDGTDWSPLGSYMQTYGSLTSSVNTIAVNGNDVYVGGWFQNVRDNTQVLYEADHVARWDGTRWLSMGSNGEGNGALDFGVLDLAAGQGVVYVGGSFSQVSNHGTNLGNAAHIAAYVNENPLPLLPTFSDVSTDYRYYRDIEILYANGLTGGCSTTPLKFCPEQILNRGQAAVFMLRGNFGSSYLPPTPIHIFKDDWTKGPWAEAWAEGMRNNGLSAGCLTNPLKYCPWDQIPREQAVIFALRLKYGKDYTPPPASGTVFEDMTDPSYYATAWAERAYQEGIISSCYENNNIPSFCPKDLVSRGLAANMIVRARNLSMPYISIPPFGAGTFDDTDSRFVYSGDWEKQTGVAGVTGNTLHVSNTLGNTIKFLFVGNELRVFFQAGPSLGTIRLTLDSTSYVMIQATSSTESYEWVLAASNNGTHTVTITHDSGGTVNFDAIIVPVVPATATATATDTSRITSSFRALSGIPCTPTPTSTPTPLAFVDVPASHPYYQDILVLSANGLTAAARLPRRSSLSLYCAAALG